jgi:ABC-2 type transport system permease protein
MHRTVIRLTARSVFGNRRGVMLFILPGLLLAVAVVVRIWVGSDDGARQAIASGLGLGLVLPLVGLIAGTGVLATEVDDGSIVYLLAKPVPRPVIAVSKLAVAVGAVAVFAALPVLVSGVILGSTREGFGYAVGALAGGTVYCALFLVLSAVSHHPVVIGLIYVFLWEGLIGSLLTGVRWVSVGHWTTVIANAAADLPRLGVQVSIWYGVVAVLVVSVLSVWLAGNRLRSFRLAAAEQ